MAFSLYCPSGHTAHNAFEKYFPAGHGLQYPFCLVVPFSHLASDLQSDANDDPGKELLPASQGLQTLLLSAPGTSE